MRCFRKSYNLDYLISLIYIAVIGATLASTSHERERSDRISARKCQEYKDLIPHEKVITQLCPTHLLQEKPYSECFEETKVYRCRNPESSLAVKVKAAFSGEFPHMAAIGWFTSDRLVVFPCSGALISEKFVLMTRTCLNDVSHKPSIVRLGDQNLVEFYDRAEPVNYKVKNIFYYDGPSRTLSTNDLALIELSKDVTFTMFVRPACLQQDENFASTVLATGWGQHSKFSATSNELIKISLNVLGNEECRELIKEENRLTQKLPNNKVCAAGILNKLQPCRNDNFLNIFCQHYLGSICANFRSAPIQVPHADASCAYTIVGLSSYGSEKCRWNYAKIYTRVEPYLDWIEATVWPQ